eukprot:scaffold174224_cov29-Tisochrysis_lutea.AAC.6
MDTPLSARHGRRRRRAHHPAPKHIFLARGPAPLPQRARRVGVGSWHLGITPQRASRSRFTGDARSNAVSRLDGTNQN